METGGPVLPRGAIILPRQLLLSSAVDACALRHGDQRMIVVTECNP